MQRKRLMLINSNLLRTLPRPKLKSLAFDKSIYSTKVTRFHKMESKINVDEWLKTLNVWDPKYDYVMHNTHFLTSKWEPDCPECLVKGKKPDLNNITSSPIKDSTSNTNTTLTTEPSSRITNNNIKSVGLNNPIPPIAVSSPAPPLQRPPTESIIPVTPIAPIQHTNRAFVTPHTSMKQFNDTFTRSTRQSTKKLLDQTAHQNLINLNETFDLYKSALEETPPADLQPNADDQKRNPVSATQAIPAETPSSVTNGISKGIKVNLTATKATAPTPSKNILHPPKQMTNFELLTNYQDDGIHHYNQASMQEAVDSQPVTSRIPRIPVRSSRNNDY